MVDGRGLGGIGRQPIAHLADEGAAVLRQLELLGDFGQPRHRCASRARPGCHGLSTSSLQVCGQFLKLAGRAQEGDAVVAEEVVEKGGGDDCGVSHR